MASRSFVIVLSVICGNAKRRSQQASSTFYRAEVSGAPGGSLVQFSQHRQAIASFSNVRIIPATRDIDKQEIFRNTSAEIEPSWGKELPDITSSPAQDEQQCPVLKLPEELVMTGIRRSWFSLHGEWYTPNYVHVATFEQNFLSSLWGSSWQKNVNIRLESTNEIAIRTKIYSDAAMRIIYHWRPVDISDASNASRRATEDVNAVNFALLDCGGNLMYVLRKPDCCNLAVHSRDGSALTTASIEQPVLRLQFIDVAKGYIVARAEAPGVGSNHTEEQVPRNGDYPILPFAIKFSEGGFNNSSPLMDAQHRWVLAAAVQAFAAFHAEEGFVWTTTSLAYLVGFSLLLIVTLIFAWAAYIIFRLIYPNLDDVIKAHYGKIAENPYFAVPARPPAVEETRYRAQQIGLHDKPSMGYSRM